MPTYEYECTKCKKTFETFQSMKDDALKTCPKDKCRMRSWGKGKVSRCLGSGAGLIFKGSGFYITDYRSEGYKSASKTDSAAASGGGSSDSGSAGSKSSGKSDSGSKKSTPKSE
jgi:putative FmdB family regulatory protein